ncbi:helix-turn-helix transcriptional regulator [Gordonia sp. SL306]|uniref:helix-turn-helix transcriptional regulator n=1 Tax=Gordonia sp. SL306 TaxID=2995145 RepID=UPI00226DD31A|nr:helix-turn-helix transcriptional regulator [Gordonia sp. SL306]WAC55801.1 helix-turn-helix transcriptional regulator [Gordonia sp. SL306]
MTVSPSESISPAPVSTGPRPIPPGTGRADAAAQRREAALARLAARRMPLPGQPVAMPVTSSPAHLMPSAHSAQRTHPTDGRNGRSHMRLIASTTPIPAGTSTSLAAPPAPRPSPALRPHPENPTRRRPGLTDREIQVLRTWLLTDSKICVAEELSISIGTVNTHLTRIRAKYTAVGRTARTKAALAARAIQDGILALDDL